VRRNKEILVLAGLLLAMVGYVLWYVIDRRARMRATPPAAAQPAGRISAGPPAGPGPVPAPVDLTQHDGQTVDFSTGRPVVKDSAEDRAAIARAKQEMDEAVKGVTFGPPAGKPPPPPEPVPSKPD
jgi:hypothetical protein